MTTTHSDSRFTALTTKLVGDWSKVSLAGALAFCVACEPLGPAAERIASRQIEHDEPEAQPVEEEGMTELELFALNADQTRVVLLLVQIDDRASLPVGESIAVEPDSDVRVVVRASGNLPQNSPVCQFIDNPLPEDVNPCADTVILYENPSPAPLQGVLELSANDDVIAGFVSAFWGEDDAVYGNFHESL